MIDASLDSQLMSALIVFGGQLPPSGRVTVVDTVSVVWP
jgi:hypothetical protein